MNLVFITEARLLKMQREYLRLPIIQQRFVGTLFK